VFGTTGKPTFFSTIEMLYLIEIVFALAALVLTWLWWTSANPASGELSSKKRFSLLMKQTDNKFFYDSILIENQSIVDYHHDPIQQQQQIQHQKHHQIQNHTIILEMMLEKRLTFRRWHHSALHQTTTTIIHMRLRHQKFCLRMMLMI
jgi:hypothetical protein